MRKILTTKKKWLLVLLALLLAVSCNPNPSDTDSGVVIDPPASDPEGSTQSTATPADASAIAYGLCNNLFATENSSTVSFGSATGKAGENGDTVYESTLTLTNFSATNNGTTVILSGTVSFNFDVTPETGNVNSIMIYIENGTLEGMNSKNDKYAVTGDLMYSVTGLTYNSTDNTFTATGINHSGLRFEINYGGETSSVSNT